LHDLQSDGIVESVCQSFEQMFKHGTYLQRWPGRTPSEAVLRRQVGSQQVPGT